MIGGDATVWLNFQSHPISRLRRTERAGHADTNLNLIARTEAHQPSFGCGPADGRDVRFLPRLRRFLASGGKASRAASRAGSGAGATVVSAAISASAAGSSACGDGVADSMRARCISGAAGVALSAMDVLARRIASFAS